MFLVFVAFAMLLIYTEVRESQVVYAEIREMAGRKSVTPDKRKPSSTKKDVAFATIIQQRRIGLGLSQTDVAKRMDIHASRVSEIESGTFPASREKLIALCRALETTPDYLFGFREEP